MRASTSILAMLLVAQPLRAELEIEHAWVRSAPPGMKMLAAYASLTNTGDSPVAVVKASSEAFERVEMHETVTTDGVSRMASIDQFVVAPGQTRRFKPLAAHFMLVGPKHDMTEGRTIKIELVLGTGETVTGCFTVKKDPTP